MKNKRFMKYISKKLYFINTVLILYIYFKHIIFNKILIIYFYLL